MSEWTKVGATRPSSRVLVLDDMGRQWTAWWSATLQRWEDRHGELVRVTHWRHLPEQPKPVGAWHISWDTGTERVTPPAGYHIIPDAEYARLRTNASRLIEVQARLADIRASLAAAQSDSRTLIAFIDDTIKRAGGVT